MGSQDQVKKRREEIADYVMEKGFASNDELMEIQKVSRMTILRDLEFLEQAQMIRKVRNGASAQPSSVFESDFGYRERVNVSQKEAVCKAAANFLCDGMSIFIDDSTTVIPLIKSFSRFRSLTVITSCLPTINLVKEITGVNLIVLGGEYKAKYRACYGDFTVDFINRIHADLSIISPHSYKAGAVFESEQNIITPKLAMMNNSERKIILMVNSKFKQTTIYFLAKISEFDHVIIDNLVPKPFIEDLRNFSKNLIIAKPLF